ncbi:DUF669 domain-containing protein [Leuconostoc lactis]|uniref:DUF669 domain-containing protein n=1 Tax=Leuconostoc lactis TaxID=1246 RepID=UPI001D11572C|nr:DUF669 domain-containing protein [Leuconostoc lactis]MCC2745044.1 DUF669 domain-containing protein [Leuconostoc lactis]MCC2755582.1 DUF669 domain-containing protein [Leuconostoc lactis]
MALFTVDSSNTFGKSVQESGRYNVKVLDSSELKAAKATGNEMLVLNYEVLDGDYVGGRVLYDNFVWNPDNLDQSEKRFNTLLVAANVPDGTPINSIQDVLRGIINKQLNIKTEWVKSDYNGKWNLSVKAYDKLDADGSKPDGKKRPDDDSAKKSSDPFNHAPQTDPFATGMPVDISDDDLPF